MKPVSKTQYELRTFATSAVYVVLVISLLPYARHADDNAIRLICALLPVLPMLYIVWLTGRRIWSSDELEQRTHLIGLGAAAAIAGAFSLVSGFLAAGKAIPLDLAGTLLIWVFPLMLLTYGLVQNWASRRYGARFCDDRDGLPKAISFGLLAVLFAAIALWAHFRSTDAFAFGLFCGLSVSFAILAAIFALLRLRRTAQEGE
ncbi:MAG: hypothetical protein JSS42_08765 [Proteobacteria bacterium]|uniref:hypothetical protein n=1 Tax=Rudaea sp. TaxID=2136325 RepID=UPI00322085ED|nr:hypothetical protein [Pseudomonadota bacterium]